MKSHPFFQRYLLQHWTANGTTVRVGTNGRHIAETGPHHTPIDQYPPGLAKEDEAHAQFIAAAPAVYLAALSVLAAAKQGEESVMEESLDALADAVKEATK